jgi:hypothetical protein
VQSYKISKLLITKTNCAKLAFADNFSFAGEPIGKGFRKVPVLSLSGIDVLP